MQSSCIASLRVQQLPRSLPIWVSRTAPCRPGSKPPALRSANAARPRRRPVRPETPEHEAARLRARVRELEAESVKLNTERDILRAAAKYFAGETNW